MLIRSRARHVPSGGGGGGGTPVTLATIADYVQLAGGQEIIVANGTYPAGVLLNEPHASPLILRAETQGGVTVDLSGGKLQLADTTSNVVFVGCNFADGMVEISGATDINFWYCDFTWPPDVWKAQYLAVGGLYSPAQNRSDRDNTWAPLMGAAGHSVNVTPIWVRKGLANPSLQCARLGFYGCDVHDCTDDGIDAPSDDGFVVGCRVWNISKQGSGGSVDPGGPLGSSNDWFHNDAMQTTGGVARATVTDSWFAQKIQWAADGNDNVDCTFDRLWHAGCDAFAYIVSAKPASGGQVTGHTSDTARAFCNGQVNGSSQNKYRTDFVDGVQKATWPTQWNAPGTFEFVSTNVTTTIPSGITVAADGFTLTDITQVRDHLLNPANVWRAANPYSSYNSYLGI